MQATITINTDEETKEEFNNFCKKLGLDISTAFNLFMKNTLKEKKIPFVYKILTIEEIKEAVCSIAPKYGIDRAYLFGSYARGEATEKSDVDIRIDPGLMKGLEFGGFYADLEDIFERKIDLLTTKQLDENFLANIKNEEILLYDKLG